VSAILVDGLTRTYQGGYQALKGVSFAVAQGDFTAIMGPSGCGKSTLLNILGLLDRPTGGKYLLEGAETARLDDSAITRLRRARIGFVFQAFNLLPRLSALENVALPMAYAGAELDARRARARELLTRVGLVSKAGSGVAPAHPVTSATAVAGRSVPTSCALPNAKQSKAVVTAAA